MNPSIWVVIVNYRTPGMAIDCLESIAALGEESARLRVVVVDNASADGSAERLEEAIDGRGWGRWASLIRADSNRGFASGSNVGIRQALQCDPAVDYVMLLNPDTIVRAGAIATLFEFMQSHPRAGIVGSALENLDGSPQCSAHIAPSPLGELVAGASLAVVSRLLHRYDVTPPRINVAHACDWVSGASLMIRRAVIDEIGLLDESYFLYFEEVDFCSVARDAGWEVWFVPESRVVHFEGSSTGIQDHARRRPAYWYESRRRYFLRHCGLSGLLLADLLWTIGRTSLAMRRLMRLGSGTDRSDPAWFTLDLLWGDFRFVVGRVFGEGRSAPADGVA